MGLRRSLIMLAFGLAMAPAACSEPAPSLVQKALPTEAELPHSFNQDCGCVLNGDCVMLEQIPGYFETRNLSCQWVRPNSVAQCRFDRRFIEDYTHVRGKSAYFPGPWREISLRTRLLPNGRWCAG